MTYQTLTTVVTTQFDIKKSQFITYAYPVQSRDKALQYVEQLREKYPDARHHCWAYIIGDPNNTTSAGFDDDGEPSGTAGKPILTVLQHKRLGNIIVIVVRYFGGIKLGAGGLTRAYASAAQSAVDEATAKGKLTIHVPTTALKVEADFANESQVRYVVEDMGAEITDVTYSNVVVLDIQLPKADIEVFQSRLGRDGRILSSP